MIAQYRGNAWRETWHVYINFLWRRNYLAAYIRTDMQHETMQVFYVDCIRTEPILLW